MIGRWFLLGAALMACHSAIEEDHRVWKTVENASSPFQESQFTLGGLSVGVLSATVAQDYILEMAKKPDAFKGAIKSRLFTMPVRFCFKVNNEQIDRQTLASAVSVSWNLSKSRSVEGIHAVILTHDLNSSEVLYQIPVTTYAAVTESSEGMMIKLPLRESCASVALMFDTNWQDSNEPELQTYHPLPPAPTNFIATNQGNTVNLSWASGEGSTVGFSLAYRDGSEGPVNCTDGTIVPASTIGNQTSWNLTDLTESSTYHFLLCAVNDREPYDFSEGVTAKVTLPSDVDSRPGSWSILSATSAPTARYRHVAVWTGSRMLIWGGVSGDGTYLTDGAIYNPDDGTWTSLNVTGAPSGRVDAVVVWTKKYWMIWGGRNSGGTALGDGAYYDPTTAQWTTITTTAVPSARYGVTAVANTSDNNNAMLLYGGNDGSQFLSSFFRYSPTSGWTDLSGSSTAPSARGFAGGIWSGSKVVVWGGAGSGTYPNDGGFYGTSWDDSLQAGGVLKGRTGHTMIWTGSQTLIWGGASHSSGTDIDKLSTPDTYYNDGAIVAHDTNAWTSMTTVNAPTARSGHSSVWDGTGLIIWGGENKSQTTETYHDGARFQPSTTGGAWYHMATSDLKSRAFHSAICICTGVNNKMIIWGGKGDAVYGDGAVFTP